MTRTKVKSVGMVLERWTHESCVADFGIGTDWATLYSIHSDKPSMGHATSLLVAAKSYYEGRGKRFGGTVALNSRMAAIYQRLAIEEYK